MVLLSGPVRRDQPGEPGTIKQTPFQAAIT